MSYPNHPSVDGTTKEIDGGYRITLRQRYRGKAISATGRIALTESDAKRSATAALKTKQDAVDRKLERAIQREINKRRKGR